MKRLKYPVPRLLHYSSILVPDFLMMSLPRQILGGTSPRKHLIQVSCGFVSDDFYVWNAWWRTLRRPCDHSLKCPPSLRYRTNSFWGERNRWFVSAVSGLTSLNQMGKGHLVGPYHGHQQWHQFFGCLVYFSRFVSFGFMIHPIKSAQLNKRVFWTCLPVALDPLTPLSVLFTLK